MRCMTCGDEMVLADALPAEAMGVQGFEHQTFQCPSCEDTECRLVFTDRPTVFARRRSETAITLSEPYEAAQTVEASCMTNTSTLEMMCDRSSVETVAFPTEEQPSGDDGLTALAGEMVQRVEPPMVEQETSSGTNVAAPAWVRAVEKLRTYQADLHQRLEQTVPTGTPSPSAAQPRNLAQLSGERLRPRALTIAGSDCLESPEPAQKPDLEATRRLNGSVAPSHSSQKPLAPVPPAPNLGTSEAKDALRDQSEGGDAPRVLTEAEGAPRFLRGGIYLLDAFEKLINAFKTAVPSRSLF
jgi:hypothetical protein